MNSPSATGIPQARGHSCLVNIAIFSHGWSASPLAAIDNPHGQHAEYVAKSPSRLRPTVIEAEPLLSSLGFEERN